jgi:hypothetical protein
MQARLVPSAGDRLNCFVAKTGNNAVAHPALCSGRDLLGRQRRGVRDILAAKQIIRASSGHVPLQRYRTIDGA